MVKAIIEDVQKLFQHVLEVAHMEGVVFKSSRREGEMREWRQRVLVEVVQVGRGSVDWVWVGEEVAIWTST